MSAAPWNMQLRRPAKLSGPSVFIASIIMPRAPLPLSGFMNAVGSAGTTSFPMPKHPRTQEIPFMSKSIAPLARNTATPTRMAIR